MDERDTTMGGSRRSFPSTIWSDILSAGDPSHPDCRERLDRLIQTYWKPVYVFIRASWSKSAEDAKDLTQAFFTYLLQKDYLARLRPERGSFRGYLRTALKHFLVDAARAEAVRRPATPLISLPLRPEDLEGLSLAAPDESPEEAYDREWYDCLFERAVASLGRALATERKETYFEVFKTYFLDPSGPTYADVAARVGVKETDVRNYLTYCRNAIREILRDCIREYVASDAEIDDELAEVLKKRV